MAVVRRDHVLRWIAGYEELWRTPGTERLAELFTPEVEYLPSPWAEPVRGLTELALFWEAERDGADEPFTMKSEVVAVDADTAAIRVAVDYHAGGAGSWRDLWVVRFSSGGRCARFEEWPFAAGAPDRYGRGAESGPTGRSSPGSPGATMAP